jgi:putative transposase
MKYAPQHTRTYFITAVCADRRRIFQTTANASLMIDVLQTNRTKNRMQIHAFVLMPDHMHLLLTPAPEVSLEKAMQFLKGGYSFRLKRKLGVGERLTGTRDSRSGKRVEKPVPRPFWAHITSETHLHLSP